jgi:hypothetical protein
VSVLPTPLDQLGSRRFSFYPPIVNIERNEWVFRRATWDDVEVVNTKTAERLTIRRHLVGEVSIAEPVILVGLLKELEYREGALYPHVRRVIEMPRAVNDVPRLRPPRPSEPVVGIRIESGKRGRSILTTCVYGLLACMAFATVFRDYGPTARWLHAGSRAALPFTAQDDYDSIVARIGAPARDEWRTSRSGVHYRRLSYPEHGYAIVLLGGRYAGAVDPASRVIHSVRPITDLR